MPLGSRRQAIVIHDFCLPPNPFIVILPAGFKFNLAATAGVMTVVDVPVSHSPFTFVPANLFSPVITQI